MRVNVCTLLGICTTTPPRFCSIMSNTLFTPLHSALFLTMMVLMALVSSTFASTNQKKHMDVEYSNRRSKSFDYEDSHYLSNDSQVSGNYPTNLTRLIWKPCSGFGQLVVRTADGKVIQRINPLDLSIGSMNVDLDSKEYPLVRVEITPASQWESTLSFDDEDINFDDNEEKVGGKKSSENIVRGFIPCKNAIFRSPPSPINVFSDVKLEPVNSSFL